MDGNANGAAEAINRHFLEQYPRESAAELERFKPETGAEALAGLAPGAAARVIERLAPEIAADIVSRMEPQTAAAIIEAAAPDVEGRIVGQLDEQARERLLAGAGPALAQSWRDLLTYEPDSAGRVMDAQYVSFREGMTAGEAMDRIRRFEKRAGTLFFITDANGVLRSQIGLKEIALANPDDVLDGMALPIVGYVYASAQREDVAEQMRKQNATALPVVDDEGRLMAVIRYSALVDAVRDEATVDIQTIFGASKDERALSTALFSVRKRLPWMQINLVTAFLAAAVVGAFESTIAKYTALAVLLPVVAGQSGNAGAQALAVTIRGLALREFRLGQWAQVASKELRVGAINGVVIAITTGIVVIIWSGSLGLATVIFLAMIVSMIIACVSGTLVPILLAKLGLDPAQSSSIVLTTVTDIAGFMSFLGIATLLASTLPS